MAENAIKKNLVSSYFGMTFPEMRREWLGKDGNYTGEPLTELDKQQIRAGLSDETLTYEPTPEQVAAARARTIEVPGGPDFVLN